MITPTTICLSMIVKDESAVIARCLNSVKPFLSSWLIVDTGSTDNTMDIIRETMKGIPGEVVQRPWRDFGSNRSEALELARPRAEFSLVIDADDVLEYAPNLKLPRLTHDAYALYVHASGIRFPRLHFFNNRLPWRYEGVLHEHAECDGHGETPFLDVIYRQNIHEGARSRDPEKYKKDARVLEEALRKDPSNRTYVFFLAQTYRDGKDWDNALRMYQKRTEMGSHETEDFFYSLYQVALLMERKGFPSQEVLGAYLRAHQARPQRAEAVCNAARFCRSRSEHGLAHIFSSAALAIPRPAFGVLYQEEWVYDWQALNEYALACGALGFLDEAQKANERIVRERKAPEDVWTAARKRLGLDTGRGDVCSAVPQRLTLSARRPT